MAIHYEREKSAKISGMLYDTIDSIVESAARYMSSKRDKEPTETYFITRIWKYREKKDIVEWRDISLKCHAYIDQVYFVTNTSGQVRENMIKPTKTLSGIQRAKTEIKKKITKYLRDNWRETKMGAKVVDDTRPMRYGKFDKFKHRIEYPCIVQPKINGVHCTWDHKKQVLWSRDGKQMKLKHLEKELIDAGLMSINFEIAFKDHHVLLQDVVEAISRQDEGLRGFVFDQPVKKTYEDRFLVDILARDYFGSFDKIKPVMTHICHNEKEVKDLNQRYVEAGYEGTMVKNLYEVYEFGGRSPFHLKDKQEFEEPMEVSGFYPEDDGGEPMVYFIMRTPDLGDGRYATFKCIPAWTHDERKRVYSRMRGLGLVEGMTTLLKMGYRLTVEYRGISKDKVPVHAVIKGGSMDFLRQLEDTTTAIDKACWLA